MNARNLNAKQKKTADLILEGVKPLDAYMQSYEQKNEKTARVAINQLLKKDYFNAYISQQKLIQQKEIEKKGIISKTDLILKLNDIMDNSIKNRPAIAIKAIEQIAKLMGYYEVQKFQHQIESVNLIIPGVNDLEDNKFDDYEIEDETE
jgi:hypothetical protein